jgi:predicted CXXCH cytochrome family protein
LPDVEVMNSLRFRDRARPAPVLFTHFLIILFFASGLLVAGQKKVAEAKVKAGGSPAGAAFSGDKACADCHSDKMEQFAASPHGRLKQFELGGSIGRCESCHGAGSKHIDEGGDASLINGFKDAEARQSMRACTACHGDNAAMHWKGSEHQMAGVACTSCHTIHQSRRITTPMARPLEGANPLRVSRQTAPPPRASLKKAEPDLCYDCHREKRAQMNMTSHHPVREGRMTCSSCHNTHGSPSANLLRNAESEKAFCTNCHPGQQGPFVFEHAAVEEGCNVCHQPHGTVADNLLKQNEPYVCLQCHEAHFHLGREGATAPVYTGTGGSTNPNGVAGWRKAFGTKCTQCHTRIHGSDLPSQGISSRGKALTR